MKALLKNYRQAPRKVRLVGNLIKGKRVSDALVELEFLTKRASLPLQKLIRSAVANAITNNGAVEDLLVVKNVTVDKGLVMKRSMPRARGSASPIHKHMSHVFIELAQVEKKEKKSKVLSTDKKVNKTIK